MAEKITQPNSGEQLPQAEKFTGKTSEKLSNKETREAAKQQQETLDNSRQQAEKLARPAAEHAPKQEKEQPRPSSRAHKAANYRHTMQRIESKLPAYQRAFSRFINNDSVDRASNLLGRTIARPSGLLGAGAIGFFGLLLFVFYAKRIGFELPNSLFLLLVIGGWFGGLLIEAVYKSLKKLIRR